MGAVLLIIYCSLALISLFYLIKLNNKQELKRKKHISVSSERKWPSEELEMIFDGSVQHAVIHDDGRPFDAQKSLQNYETAVMKETVRMIAQVEVDPFGYADGKPCSDR